VPTFNIFENPADGAAPPAQGARERHVFDIDAGESPAMLEHDLEKVQRSNRRMKDYGPQNGLTSTVTSITETSPNSHWTQDGFPSIHQYPFSSRRLGGCCL